jgi:hypothetical protein
LKIEVHVKGVWIKKCNKYIYFRYECQYQAVILDRNGEEAQIEKRRAVRLLLVKKHQERDWASVASGQQLMRLRSCCTWQQVGNTATAKNRHLGLFEKCLGCLPKRLGLFEKCLRW